MPYPKYILIASALVFFSSAHAHADSGGLDRTRQFYDSFKSEQQRLRTEKATAGQEDKDKGKYTDEKDTRQNHGHSR